jgi:hypothetical protein
MDLTLHLSSVSFLLFKIYFRANCNFFSNSLSRNFHISIAIINAWALCRAEGCYYIVYTFRVDRDICATKDSKSPAASYVGEVESPFRKLAPHLSLSYDLMTTSRLIPLIIFQLANIFSLRWDFMGTYGIRVTSVQSFRLIWPKLCQNSTPLPKKGRGIGMLKPSVDSTRVGAANYR